MMRNPKIILQISLLFIYAVMGKGNLCQTTDKKNVNNSGVTYSGGLKLNEITKINLEELEKQKIFINRIHTVDVDNRGNIYIGDDESRIVVISQSGKFVRLIGRLGEGPGEFKNVSCLRLTSKELLFVLDSKLRRISRFNSKGEYLSSFQYNGLSYNFDVTEDESIYISNLAFLTKDGLIDKYSITGVKLKSFVENDDESKLIHQSGNSGFVKAFDMNKLLYSYPFPYRVLIMDKNGLVKREFTLSRKEFVGLASKAKNVDGRFLGSDLPSRIKGVYYSGEYIVVHSQLNGKNNVIDTFSKDGKYLSSIKLAEDNELLCIKNKLLYVVNRGINSYPAISVYELIKH